MLHNKQHVCDVTYSMGGGVLLCPGLGSSHGRHLSATTGCPRQGLAASPKYTATTATRSYAYCLAAESLSCWDMAERGFPRRPAPVGRPGPAALPDEKHAEKRSRLPQTRQIWVFVTALSLVPRRIRTYQRTRRRNG